ncbi:major facilitator superfamily domain-containing protein [Thelephora terrestris]|uniref:Major facilitator superfamily domain-containing protein n=1 Tax=Thelephora terrestris TaxID=56493 RepID=A0A9P6L753_9AGAM|nr:major facilitator superfamily domain-containing protein [Thelephora terrestris]
MTASLRSSQTATTDPVQDHDPEAPEKAIGSPIESDISASEKSLSPWEITLEESEDPKNMATWYKWVIVLIVSSGAMCVTSASSMAAFVEAGIMEEFGISSTVAILPISLFLMGLGTGPLLVGPLSEVHGRNPVYLGSFAGFFIFSWPVAFAPNAAVLIFFRFITGLCGAAFLSVAGGTVSDLFSPANLGSPMSVYSMAPFLGPVIGPLAAGFINQNLDWRWTFYVIIIWVFVVLVALLFVRETYVPVLERKKAVRLRKETGDERYYSLLEKENPSLLRLTIISCYRPFQVLLYDRMVLLLDIWTALTLGILYLAFQAFPIIFGLHGFSEEFIGLSFLGIGVGMILASLSQPYWNRLTLKEIQKHGSVRPESRLIMGQVGGILIPIGLFWIAFTTYRSVHWIVPIIGSIPFGMGICYTFTSVFTYLISAYRPIAASVLASNSFIRSCFACAFPLFTSAMYETLGTVGATALVAGLAAVFAPLPFIFYKIGPRLRAKSKFAAH